MMHWAQSNIGRWVTATLHNGKEIAGRLQDVDAGDPKTTSGAILIITNKDGRGFVPLMNVAGLFIAEERGV